jgi:plasmid stabilization system protein ParE
VSAVVVTKTAQRNLETLIRTHSLPPTSRERVSRSIQHLARFPRIGAPLHGRWEPFRFVLGPWRWMIVVYHYDEPADRVVIVTIQDARTVRAASVPP